MFFFFQAEDGIRDLVRSRGLGDVYKRQYVKEAVKHNYAEIGMSCHTPHQNFPQMGTRRMDSVSYTHLTMPTIYSV